MLATIWCLDHYIPLLFHAEDDCPWTLVPYERLVAFGEEELQRLMDAIGIQVRSGVRD